MAVDFNAVMWARHAAKALEPLRSLEASDLGRLIPLVQAISDLAEAGIRLSDQQLAVILQNMYGKNLVQVQADKGGILAEFTGGGFEYERFLVRSDGRVPNSRYEAKTSRDT